MTTAVHPSSAKACLICGGRLSTIAENLSASSSRADGLYPLALFECSLCGHVQKDVGPEYQAHLDEVYRVAYTLPGGGRKNNISNGTVVSREKTLARTLGSLLGTSVLDVGTGMGYLLAAFSEELPRFEVAGYDLNDEKDEFIRANGATDFISEAWRTFAECPISVPETPEGSVVVVAYNTPEASRQMCERLKQLRPEIDFVAPPIPSPADFEIGARRAGGDRIGR